MSRLRQNFWTGKEAPVPQGKAVVQIGALCLRKTKGTAEVLLVKSSRGRWIVPKGWPIDGLTDAEAAKVEAWEEAGVAKGKISKKPVGGYLTVKRFDDGRKVPCHVNVFQINVKNMVDSYPEAGPRRRKWMPVKKAAKKVEDDGLRLLLKAVS
ncbi:MAG: NUDIX hydrolase [Pseudomonadota bacterium]